MCQLAYDSVLMIREENNGVLDIDVKRFIKIEKVTRGLLIFRFPTARAVGAFFHFDDLSHC